MFKDTDVSQYLPGRVYLGWEGVTVRLGDLWGIHWVYRPEGCWTALLGDRRTDQWGDHRTDQWGDRRTDQRGDHSDVH